MRARLRRARNLKRDWLRQHRLYKPKGVKTEIASSLSLLAMTEGLSLRASRREAWQSHSFHECIYPKKNEIATLECVSIQARNDKSIDYLFALLLTMTMNRIEN